MNIKKNRIKNVEIIEDVESHISINSKNINSKLIKQNNISYYKTKFNFTPDDEDRIYHFPMIFNEDGTPWYKGNQFIFKQTLTSYYKENHEPTIIHRKASRLLDFKIWCEENNINMFDFSASRPKNRPTYRYFKYLSETGISAGNINQRTKLIYEFICEFSKHYNIDIDRIDSVNKISIPFKNKQGHLIRKDINQRSLTKKINKKQIINSDTVLDEGEHLRPLNPEQQKRMLDILSNEVFSIDERLIFHIALDTGVRLQTILTMRIKHITSLIRENLSQDRRYRIDAGYGTLIDTKRDKKTVINIHESLVEQLLLYIDCKSARSRREKFNSRFGGIFEEIDDMYIFLTNSGDCRYMARSDPRYKTTRYP